MFEPGVAVRLNSRVRRLTAPNPGIMTGPGTNTYLLGDREIAVLDPGPLIDEHVQAIVRTGAGRIRWIVTTHTHSDHSPAWLPLQRASGAEVIGAKPWDDRFQDDTFHPHREVADQDLLQTEEFTLRALHTPGHVGNHYCYLLEEEGMLFTGDHIMQGSTVVIVPPSGDMQAYINSLTLLLDYPLRSLAPGHGGVMEDPVGTVKGLIQHRLGREQKVLDGVRQLGPANLDELVLVVYDDVGRELHEMAKLSMTAHLIKLQREGRAHCDAAQCWSLPQ